MATATVTAPHPTQRVPELPPGPRAGPLLTVRFLLRAPQLLDGCARRYGDMFTVATTPERVVVITSDPAVIKQVFTGDPNLLYAGEGNQVLAPLLGPRSVLTLDGAEHMRQRKLMLPSFHGERMQAYGELMADVTAREIATWPRGSAFPVLPATQAITLQVIMRAVFGIRDDRRREELGRLLRDLMDTPTKYRTLVMLQMTSSAHPRPRSTWGRFRAAVRRVDAVLYDEIRERRADPGAGDREDVLSLLLQARDEDGEPLTDSELRDELMTLLVAGHETTATALAWTLERLVRHPAVLARLRDEVAAGDDEYLDAVIAETLRLRPVVPAVIRRLKADMEFGGRLLPEGAHIAPSIYLTHRRADLYPEPLDFRPERFLGVKPGTYTWIPFGGGVRRCLGASFALYETRVVLRTILEHVVPREECRPGERIARRAITYAPARGGRIGVADAR